MIGQFESLGTGFGHTLAQGLGQSSAGTFTMMKLMGHLKLAVSQAHVHRTPESIGLTHGA